MSKKHQKEQSFEKWLSQTKWHLLKSTATKCYISQLRPDILLYSTSTKTVIILELTCPCEQNIESWQATKFGKYDPLSSAIKTNGWSIHFFAVEVAAWGYCAFTIRSCLMRVGLTRKLVRSSLKTLSSAPLTASFQIWLCRDSREWIIPNTDDGITPTAMESSSKSKLPFQQDNNRKYGTNNCGLVNKDNTCYVDASLQCLSTMGKFWSNFSVHTNELLQFVAAFVKIMSLLQTSKGALDPSYFLKYLKQIISKAGNAAFDLYFPSRMLLKSYHIFWKNFVESLYIPVNLIQFISDRLSFTQHASSILQLKTHLLFSSCLFQSRPRGP